jgi:transposase
VRIGQEVTQELERIELCYVHRIVRIKRACPDKACPSGVVTAPLPGRVIDKGILGPGFIAHVIYERFGNHMPYHRQEQKYKAEGLSLSRTVLCDTTMRCAELLEPVYEAHKLDVLASYVVQSDDTPVTQCNGKDKGRQTGRIWAYRAQEGGVFFEYRPDRSRASPLEVLGDRKGYVQADAYSGYDELFETSSCVELGCWAHARRKFDEAKTTEPSLAKEILDLIGKLYEIEREAKEQRLDDDRRLQLRQERSVPVLDQIKDWLEGTLPDVLPKSPMAGAIQYALRQWEALKRFAEDGGILDIDNNGCERMVRPVAIGRKNWMFIGSREGGERSAVLMSLVNSCKELGINPLEYLRDVLIQIDVLPASEVHKLTPRGWKKDQEAARRAQLSRQAVAAAVASLTFDRSASAP